MNQWINLHALWQILVLGMICGAGLPALFAVGLRALSAPGSRTASGPEEDQIVGGSVVGIATAVVCFAVVVVAIGWGLYLIVSGS
ncbi:hypothetical protein SAMN05444157_1358 [Frankineae bacterium MT45]|nr:hypothetical protein SAMN05444157_1358 [Frankineae bacterium MT45]